MIIVNTSIEPFSERYAITQFNVDIGDYNSLTMSLGRAEDIRYFWWDVETASDAVDGHPIVLKTKNRHLITKESVQVEYDTLQVPRYMMESGGIESFLIPDERHAQLLTTY
jgi:hypothetical protein